MLLVLATSYVRTMISEATGMKDMMTYLTGQP